AACRRDKHELRVATVLPLRKWARPKRAGRVFAAARVFLSCGPERLVPCGQSKLIATKKGAALRSADTKSKLSTSTPGARFQAVINRRMGRSPRALRAFWPLQATFRSLSGVDSAFSWCQLSTERP